MILREKAGETSVTSPFLYLGHHRLSYKKLKPYPHESKSFTDLSPEYNPILSFSQACKPF